MSSVPLYSVIIPNTETEHAGPIRRSPKAAIQGHLALNGCFTCFESFQRSVDIYPDNPCLGQREIDTKTGPGNFEFLTYSEVGNEVQSFASGLHHEQLLTPNEDGIRMLGIFLKNCRSWIIAEQATFYLGAATLPLFDSFRIENIEFILTQTAVCTILCSVAEASKLLIAAKSVPTLQVIILNCKTVPEEVAAEASQIAPSIRILTWDQVMTSGQGNGPIPPSPPSSKDIATFCYTSGTTGLPKGAVITHQNLMVVVTGGLEAGFKVTAGDVYLSFLPLPHIFERIIITGLLASGAQIGFYRGDPLLIIEDLKALRPTVLCAVPRLLTRIHDKVTQAGSKAPGLKGFSFRCALDHKRRRLRAYGQTSHFLWDRLVFGPICRALGLDRVARVLSGGAPLHPEVMEFFRLLLGSKATCHEGYGMTETTGATTTTASEDLDTGHVGGPLPSVDLRLLDVPEMGYLHTDTAHSGKPCMGRGEISVRGPGVFTGYYHAADETAKALSSDGWLLTGDIGMWTAKGQLVIIDRRKNLFKLSQGEYVAVERVENVLSRAPLVSQIFVHGQSTENCVVAVVVPDQEEADKWAAANTWTRPTKDSSALQPTAEPTEAAGEGKREDEEVGRDSKLKAGADLTANQYISSPIGDLCLSPEFRDAVLLQLTDAGKEGHLAGFEMVKAVYLEVEPWSPQDSSTSTVALLTPTLKLRRDAARQKYSLQLSQMYEELRTGVTKQPESPTRAKL